MRISPIEKGIAYALAVAVVVVLIALVLYPRVMNDGTLAIVRFLAALAGGLSASLFLGEVQAQGNIRKVLIRASGGFAMFIIILLLFFYGIPRSNSSQEKPISLRYLTGVNDYPTLTLSLLSPDINDAITLRVLSQFLGIENPPTVHSANPVFESIEKFKLETGNENTISTQNEYQYLLYSMNDNGSMVSDGIDLLNPDRSFDTQDGFEVAFKGEDDTYMFHYAPISLPLQLNRDSAKYTTFIEGQRNNFIVQYPKLDELSRFGIKDDFSYEINSSLKDTWIRKVIQENPDVRGFFAFAYPYTKSIEEFVSIVMDCRSLGDLVERLMPSPYVRFLDIENVSSTPITLDSIWFKIAELDSYKLTPVDNRSLLFKDAIKKDQSFGIQIKPKHHLFIPIEFGFDTKPQKEIFNLVSPGIFEEQQASLEKIIIAKPVSSLEYSSYERCLSASREMSISDFEDTIHNECIKFIAQASEIGNAFKQSLSAPETLIQKIPRRFSVGSIISITSLQINGNSIPVPPPQNNPEFIISSMFNEGSCPYLLVYEPDQESWFDLGTVIRNRRAKIFQGTDKYYLGNKIRRIKLEEREAEVSYIDSIEFLFEDSVNGKIQEVSSTIPSLSKIDGNYVVLQQGSTFQIDFSEIVPPSAVNIQVKINGYYEAIQESAGVHPSLASLNLRTAH